MRRIAFGRDFDRREGDYTAEKRNCQTQIGAFNYHYVYTLESLSKPDEIYTGQTQDLKQRRQVETVLRFLSQLTGLLDSGPAVLGQNAVAV